MKDDKRSAAAQAGPSGTGSLPNRILGSLRDALNAASRDDRSGEITLGEKSHAVATGAAADLRKQAGPQTVVSARAPEAPPAAPPAQPHRPSAAPAHALREAKSARAQALRAERAQHPVPARQRPRRERRPATPAGGDAKTQALRGKPKVVRNAFHQDPVVGWLVWSAGRGSAPTAPSTRATTASAGARTSAFPLDFGDDTISSEEQAYIRYNSMDRSFLFVPNLSKTNIVAVNDKKPTGAVKLELMDVITMGRTQLAFVPFCGEEFDWSELSDLKE